MRSAMNAFVAASLFGASFLSAIADDARRVKKLIATGWDKPDQVRFHENIDVIEEQPFQGVMISVTGTRDDGKTCSLRSAHTAQPWQRSWFDDAVRQLKSAGGTRFTDNFVSIGANPGDVDWFDDEGWKNVAEHWGIAAWIAREAGFRGFLFDPEPYTKPYRQFAYGSQAERENHTFDEYCEKARERGREVMRAVAAEYPDIVVFCYFMNSVNRSAAKVSDSRAVLESSGYGLYPSFIDGWLDVIPPEATLVDGCESAYRFNDEKQYLRSAVLIKGDCQNLVSPENRARYRAQVQVSFGIYLDAYWNPADSQWDRWRVDCGDRKPVEKLLENVRNAVACCDEYVWIYGEKFRWWPTPNGRVFAQSWPEALPGIDMALRLARDPENYARHLLEQAAAEQRLENLARNGDFQAETAQGNGGVQADWREGGAPAGWSFWQLNDGTGQFAWDREAGAAKAWAVPTSGCFIQSYDVSPEQSYAVRARVRSTGKSRAWIRLRWQTPDGKWTREALDVAAAPSTPAEDGWSEIFGAATVPDGVGKLVLLLGMGSQATEDDAVWFDNVEVYRLAESDMFRQDPVRWDLRTPAGQ
jgi:hypothetical protein